MLDLLNFIFSGFWTFLGCLILLCIVCQTILGVTSALLKRNAGGNNA